MKNKKYLLSVAALSALLLAGCSDSNSTAPASAEKSAAPSASAATTAEATKEVTIEANDDMQFNVKAIEVKRGETVKIILKNVGTMPKESMGHNFVLLALRTDVNEFTMAAATEARNDYLPQKFKGKILAHTKLIGPGETAEVTFTAPKNSGKYDFICSFPGHAAAGMKGILTVL